MTGRRTIAGTTLVELVASIVIVAIAVFGLMLVVAGVTGRSADPLIEQQAGALAEAYLEEVRLAAFCDPDFLTPGQTCRTQCVTSACGATGCGGGNPVFNEGVRNLYDDICDYDGLVDAGARTRDNVIIAGLESYGITVNVRDDGITLGAPALASSAGQVVRIDVTVSHPGLPADVVVSGFRANAQ